jgi:hypothetical protein
MLINLVEKMSEMGKNRPIGTDIEIGFLYFNVVPGRLG